MKFKLISAFILGSVVSLIGCDVKNVSSNTSNNNISSNGNVSNNKIEVSLRQPIVKTEGICIGNCPTEVHETVNDTKKNNLLSDSKEPNQVNQTPEEKKRVIHEFRASFDSDSIVLHQTYDNELNELASKMAQYPNSQLSITGYADQSEANFQQLAIDRAKGLGQVLSSYKIPHNRININSQVGRSNIDDSNKKVVAVLTL